MDKSKILIADEDMAHMVEDVLAAFNRHDLEYVANWHAKEALHHQPNRSEPLHGREAIRGDYLQSTWIPFPISSSNWIGLLGRVNGFVSRGRSQAPTKRL